MQADKEEEKKVNALDIPMVQNNENLSGYRSSFENSSLIENDGFHNNSSLRKTLIFDSDLEEKNPEAYNPLHEENNPLYIDIPKQNIDYNDFSTSIDKDIQKTTDFLRSIIDLSMREKNKIYKNFLRLLLKNKDYLNSYQALKQQVKNIPNSNHLTDLDKALRLEIGRLEGLKKRSIAEREKTKKIGVISNSVLDLKTNKSRFSLRGMDTLISDSNNTSIGLNDHKNNQDTRKFVYYDFIDGKHQLRKESDENINKLKIEKGKRSIFLETEDIFNDPFNYGGGALKTSSQNDFFLSDGSENRTELRFQPYQYATDNFNKPMTRLEYLLNNLDCPIIIDQIHPNKSQIDYLDKKLKELSFVKKIKNYFDKKAIQNPKVKMKNFINNISKGKIVIDPYLALQVIQSDIDLFNGKIPFPRKLEKSLSQMVCEIKNVKNLFDLEFQLDAIMIQVKILVKSLIFYEKKMPKSQKEILKKENPKNLQENEDLIFNILNSISTQAYLFVNKTTKFNEDVVTEKFKYLNHALFDNVQSLENYCKQSTEYFNNNQNNEINENEKIIINTNDISGINRNMSNNKELYVDYIANKYKLPWDKTNNENNNK